MAEKIDYLFMLSDMKAKRSALDVSIAGLEAAIASGALGQSNEVSPGASGTSHTTTGASVELPVGAFMNKSVPAAIKLYLAAVKKKQTNTEIARALQEGGIESTADNFSTNVTTALNRLKAADEVLRFKDGWGLAEHYNESLRARLSQNQKPVRKAKKKVPRKIKAKGGTETVAATKPIPSAKGPKRPQAAIEEYVGSLEGQRITTAQVAAALNMRKQTVALILAKIAHAGAIDRNQDGSFDVGKVEGMVNCFGALQN
jgi:hypothetical protein